MGVRRRGLTLISRVIPTFHRSIVPTFITRSPADRPHSVKISGFFHQSMSHIFSATAPSARRGLGRAHRDRGVVPRHAASLSRESTTVNLAPAREPRHSVLTIPATSPARVSSNTFVNSRETACRPFRTTHLHQIGEELRDAVRRFEDHDRPLRLSGGQEKNGGGRSLYGEGNRENK